MPRGIPNKPKNSATPGQARSEKGVKRPPRVPMGAGMNLFVPPAIREEIDLRGCVPRWGLDNDKGRMAQYLAAYWEPYKDANGKTFEAPSGSGRQHVLMMLDKTFHEEDKALKRKRNSASLQAKAKLEKGDGFQEYIPEGHEYVIHPDL